MKYKELLAFLSCVFTLQGNWVTSDANKNVIGIIQDITRYKTTTGYLLTKINEFDKPTLFTWTGTQWIKARMLEHDILKMQAIDDSLFLLTQADPQELLLFFNQQISSIYRFESKEPIINFLPYEQDIFIIKNAIIRILNAQSENIWHLSDLTNVSDFAVDSSGFIWAVEKEIIGQGRQTTLFIKLKQWNPKTKLWRLLTQQVGPRIFKLATGVAKDIWSLQGETPKQLFAFKWNKTTQKWDLKGSLKGFKAITVAQDGTVWAVHHNNTIYEWREN
ncbi:MAG: hypothetical protein ACOYT8_01850 [Candidatus Dependentiae bacterium]